MKAKQHDWAGEAAETHVAEQDANRSGLPQTVWEIKDKDWGFAHGHAFWKPKNPIRAIVTILPEKFFQ
jgi:hypothetical protein